jgi:hypothetical protein
MAGSGGVSGAGGRTGGSGGGGGTTGAGGTVGTGGRGGSTGTGGGTGGASPDAGGGSGNCITDIKNGGYAFPPADPCSACRDNATLLEMKCTAMIDCLQPKWPCSGNCWTECLNQVGGSGVVANCVDELTTAACGP